jgi:hypothetical protein
MVFLARIEQLSWFSDRANLMPHGATLDPDRATLVPNSTILVFDRATLVPKG